MTFNEKNGWDLLLRVQRVQTGPFSTWETHRHFVGLADAAENFFHRKNNCRCRNLLGNS